MTTSNVPSMRRHYWISQSIILVLVLTAIWTIWYPNGYIVFSDFDFGLDDADYIDHIFGLYNPDWSSTNFFNLSRLFFITPFYALSLIFNDFVPHFLLRSIITGSLLISAFGMYKLCERILHAHFGHLKSGLHYYGLIIPSLFYALNPWVIIRIQHVFLLAGYAFFPLVLRYFFELFDGKEQPLDRPNTEADSETKDVLSRKQKFPVKRRDMRVTILSIKLAICFTLGCAAIHYLFYYSITLFFYLVALLIRKYALKQQSFRDVFRSFYKKTLVMSLSIFLLSSYWLVPYFTSSLFLNIEPKNINVTDTLSMFSRYSDVKNVLYMVSYWWPMFDMNQMLTKSFWFSGGVFLAMIAYAVFYRYSWHFYVRLFTWSAVVAMVVALGVNTSLFSNINVFVVTKIPLIGQIFRDPNKLIGPMALFFSVLICFAVDKLSYFLKQSGYGRWIQALFIGSLLVAMGLYYKPYYQVFVSNYYAGHEVPSDYKKVQDNYIDNGKIMWTPAMSNMSVSNGLFSYDWNMNDTAPTMKISSDFHMYASAKPSFTPYEGNQGIISYFQSFIQNLLDMGGGQHLGTLFSWAGFNEIGFHQDVFGQEQRQAYNLKVLQSQTDLRQHYANDSFKLFDTGSKQPQLSAYSRLVYNTKGLSSLLGLLDYQNPLQIKPDNTALFWGPEQPQSLSFDNEDLILGDNLEEIVFPQLDPKYFTFPSDVINTGNPYTGWAKTMMSTPDWSWIIKSNHIQSNEWNYDFNGGIAYTYTSHKIASPSYKLDSIKGTPIITMKDVLDGLFTPSNPDLMKLNYSPDPSTRDTVLTGSVAKGNYSAAIWQTAQSKLIEFNERPDFIRIKAIVSGVRAGKLHFKARFFDEDKNELGVAYINKDNDDTDFTKAMMKNDAAVPERTKYMRIDIMSSDEVTRNMYFYIHDFEVSDISAEVIPNSLSVPVFTESSRSDQSSEYRTFIRLFYSQVGGSIALEDARNKRMTFETKGSSNRFIWIDAGNLSIKDQLYLYPGEGLNVINAIVTIPSNQYDQIISEATSKIKGHQTDVSTIIDSYKMDTTMDLRTLSQKRLFPGSLLNTLTPVTNGTLEKFTDILFEGDYRFVFTGNISQGSQLDITLIDSNGNKYPLQSSKSNPIPIQRSLQGYSSDIDYKENQYFLQLKPIIQPGWSVMRYDYEPLHLQRGKYRILINMRSQTSNLIKAEDAHLLDADEIIVPKELVDNEQQLLTYYIMDHSPLSAQKSERMDGSISFENQPTSSPQWMIVGLNAVNVKKGQLVAFKTDVDSENVHNFHAKLVFMDSNHRLVQSVFAENTETVGKENLFLTIESPVDGIMQPILLYNGDPSEPGRIAIKDSQLYIVDDLIKVETTALLPENVPPIPTTGVLTTNDRSFRSENNRYLLYNEAFNPIWQLSGDGESVPLAMNLLQNGFALTGEVSKGRISLNPAIVTVYFLFLTLSIMSLLVAVVLLLVNRYPRKVKQRVPPLVNAKRGRHRSL